MKSVTKTKKIGSSTYKEVDTRTLEGLKAAERLHTSGKWQMTGNGFYTVTFKKIA